MRLLRIPFAIVGIIAAVGGWLTLGERLGRPERAVATSQPPDHDDPVAATFTLCDGPVRTTCVVDGDTFWFRGDKIRIADIDAPEIVAPRCRDERQVGELARDRLLVLLNAGAFSLSSGWRDTDRYGRKLRTVERAGRSIGEMLVEDGLARRWGEPRRDWCTP